MSENGDGEGSITTSDASRAATMPATCIGRLVAPDVPITTNNRQLEAAAKELSKR